jgi:DnaJ-class molecular chaperone
MADDPYAVLGVSRSASDDDIRKAFRKLAKELHPDVNPGNDKASERFKKVSQAWDILGDPDKRKKFDRGEIDAAGEPRHTYGHAGAGAGAGAYGRAGGRPRSPVDDMGFGDIFSDLFGGASGGPTGSFGGARYSSGPGGFSAQGQDARYTLDVDFLEAVRGARKRVTMPDGASLDISVPEGVSDGQVLRLRGKGHPSPTGGRPGDALVEVKVGKHPRFERDGETIRSTVSISVDEAILGGKIPVETVHGTVQLTIPKGTSSGKTMRLRGKGVKARSGQAGDHLVTVQIVLPDEIDDSLAVFMDNWRLEHGYDPRKS